jgi:3-hydroxyisobutyrate dehydrogenase
MGSNIAGRLMEAGHCVVLWNRTAGKLAPLVAAGASKAETPGELANAVEAVITTLTGAAAIEAVYSGPNGLLIGVAKDKIFLEMSTVSPDIERTLASKVRASGAAFVECPVSGNATAARNGALLGLIGGEPSDVARAKPILDRLCRRVLHAGPVGSGSVLKLAVNLPLMIYWQALGEQLAMANGLEVDPAELLDFLSETSGAAVMLKQRIPGLVAKLTNAPSDPGTFSLDNGIKDIKEMLNESRRRGIELPLVERTLECYEQFRRDSPVNEEVSSLPVYWANRKR